MKTTIFRVAVAGLLWCGFGGTALADGEGEPIPSYYEEPGLSRTRDYVNQHANERIDPFTGKLQWHFVDLFIPGNGGLDLKVQRSYSSLSPFEYERTLTGMGWTMHFGRLIVRENVGVCDTGNPPSRNRVFELPDGSRRVLFVALDGVSWITTDFWRAECNIGGPVAGLNIFSPDGTKYEMTTPGHGFGGLENPQGTLYATRITDRNGNWMSISYGFFAGGLLGVTGVSTSDGRTLTFNYDSETQLLDNITDGIRVWRYKFIPSPVLGHFFLTEVLRPDGNKWLFEYNDLPSGTPGNYSIKKVTYPQGGTISYTYNNMQFAMGLPISTVVTQKVATPGGTWTWAYEPATAPLPIISDENGVRLAPYNIPPTSPEQAAQSDKTTVTGPDGSRTHYHIGYHSVSPGLVYALGSLMGVYSFEGAQGFQIEGASRTGMIISNQTNARPGGGIADAQTAAVLEIYRDTSRFGEIFSTTFENFDSFGNPQTITETGSNTRTTNVTYFTNPSKWIVRGVKKDETVSEIISPTETETLATTRTFDPNGNLLTEARAGVTTSFSYHPTGDLASRTDARLKTTNYLNYRRGIAQTENQPEAVTISRVVSDAGNVTSETDGELATTNYTYDALNRVTGITHPLGNAVKVDWTATSRTVTRGPYREVITYDGFGREVGVQHTDTATAEAISQVYELDAVGRRTFTSYPNSPNLGTGFVYDMLNRLTFVLHENNRSAGTWVASRQNQYFSNQIWTTNERNFQYGFKYRSYSNPDKRELIGITDPLSNLENTTIARNIAGQMKSVTQAGVTRSYGYDSRYFLTSITDPETGTTVMGRDEVGNMTSRQVGTSGVTNYVYDDRNRLTAITYPTGTPGVTKTYYKDDKPRTVNNTVSLWEYFYDANKNLTREKLTIGAKIFETQYAYNGNDALSSLTYGSGRSVSYAPDAFGRPRQVAPYVTAVSYHPTGQPSSFTYANGVQTTIGLNTRQWPSTLQVAKGTSFFNTTYAYDHLGNVTSIADTVDTAYNRTATYDPLDRLTGITGPWGTGTISYDLRGNITSQSLGSFNLNYTYDPATERLQSASGSKGYLLSYDVYGNVTANVATTFNYDDASNMRCAKCGQPDEVRFDYDGANQRIRQQKGAAETFFVHGHGGQLLWEETPNVNLKEYIYLGGKQIATREQALP